jgi:spore germination protein GerM
MCSRQGIIPVQRKVPVTQTPIQDTIKLLLKGELTNYERAQGITTEYPLEGLSLEGASLNDGVLTLQFNDPNYKTGGGSCRVGILWFQIEKTAKQFAGVQQVRFLPEELFQP